MHWKAGATSRPSPPTPARLGDDEADILRVEPTLAAVRLMRSFGVPVGVELDGVERFLRQAATPSWIEALAPQSLELVAVQSYRYVAEVGLRELLALREARGLASADDGLARGLYDRRLLLGALALVGLCIVATGRAAVSERRARPTPSAAPGPAGR